MDDNENNPGVIGRAYQSLDNAVMSCVEKGVHGWNWLSGDTKSELANKMLTIAPIVELAGLGVISPQGIGALMFAPPLFILSHVNQVRNKKMEKKEFEASEAGLKDLDVESRKIVCAVGGYTSFATAGGFGYLSIIGKGDVEGTYALSAGFALRGIAEQVMRCDNLPPRKNAFQRGWEYLGETISSRRAKPLMELSR